MKSTLRLNKQTPNCMVYGEVGRKPIRITIKIRMINYWLKLVTAEDNKISTNIYLILRKLHEKDTFNSSWLNGIKTILDSCGMSNVWRNPNNYNITLVQKSLNLRLNDMYFQEWNNDVNKMSSCRFYKTYKEDLKIENYILKLNTVNRIHICKFRCRNIKIPVIVLGYKHLNIPYENRLCTLCHLKEVGNEYHYMMTCSYFNNSRMKYIDKYFWEEPNIYKFSQIFKNKDIHALNNLSKLIKCLLLEFN